MKILAFSDLHLSRSKAAALVEVSTEADLVIGAGDFCNMRKGLDDALALLQGLAAPMLVVPGNAESPEELDAALGAGVENIHGVFKEVGGLRFFGLGCAVPVTPFGAWSVDLPEQDAADILAGCEAVDVLVLHSPPKGVGDTTSAGMSVGSTAIREAIERLQPRLALCGHIHDSWGATGQIGQTQVVNLGPMPNWFEL